MRQFYSLLKTIPVLSALMLAGSAQAQSPTTVQTSNTCAVAVDFNSGNGSFTSPSIYSDQYDYEFNYTGAGPNGRLVTSSQATLAPYEASLISPIYQNTALTGTANVGFSYTAPAGTLYRIRVIRPNVVSGGADILATTSQGPPVIGSTANWRTLPAGSGTVCLLLQDADLVTGQPLRYEFTFYVTSTAAPVTFDNFSLNSIAAAPLPVNFMGIVAQQQDNGINVRWDVADESNVREYHLERSTDASTFTSVGTVTATRKAVYGATDLSAKAPTVYYRIRSVDIDGRTKYSGIIRVENGSSFAGSLKVYPSPARGGNITLQHSRLGAGARISVTSLDGKVLKLVIPTDGASNTMVDVSGLSAGMYIIRLDNGKGKIESTTFLKQ